MRLVEIDYARPLEFVFFTEGSWRLLGLLKRLPYNVDESLVMIILTTESLEDKGVSRLHLRSVSVIEAMARAPR